MEISQFRDSLPLRQLCTDIIDCPHSTPTWTKQGVIVLRNQNIRNGQLDLSEPSYTDEVNFAKRTQRALPVHGDLVITREAPMGEVCMIPVGLRCCLGQRMVLLRPNCDTVVPNYLLYAIQSSTVQDAIRLQGGTGSTVSNLRIPVLSALEIPLPTLQEQQAIAEALSDVDGLISALDALIAKKRAIKQGAMQELLTGQRRLPGFAGAWEVVKFADVADKKNQWSITGGPFGSNLKADDYTLDGIRIIQLQNIGDGIFHNDYQVYTSQRKADELLSCNIYPGEIILSKMGDPVARACFVPNTDRRYLMCSDGIRLVVDKNRFDKRFVHDYINSTYFRSKAIEASTGSTRQRIGLEDLKLLPFAAPPFAEQTAIAQILADMDAEIAALVQKREKTVALKQGMMQELLTGKTRLV